MKKRFTKTRNFRNVWVLALLANLPFAAWGQISHVVDVTNNKFTPAEITINQGDTVIWTNSEGTHNVNGLQTQWPSNPESFGNDVAAGWEFSFVFTLAGVYDYQCDPHVRSGMFGKVNVIEFITAIASADELGSGLAVYPNPALDKLNVTTPEAIQSISIINVLGSSIRYYRNLQGNEQLISLDGIDAGIYFLEVKTSDGQQRIRRFVKR